MTVNEGRVSLGCWRLPASGQRVRVFLCRDDRSGTRVIEFEWTGSGPRACDERFYSAVIRPAVIRRAQEYLEQPGQALVIEV